MSVSERRRRRRDLFEERPILLRDMVDPGLTLAEASSIGCRISRAASALRGASVAQGRRRR